MDVSIATFMYSKTSDKEIVSSRVEWCFCKKDIPSTVFSQVRVLIYSICCAQTPTFIRVLDTPPVKPTTMPLSPEKNARDACNKKYQFVSNTSSITQTSTMSWFSVKNVRADKVKQKEILFLFEHFHHLLFFICSH